MRRAWTTRRRTREPTWEHIDIDNPLSGRRVTGAARVFADLVARTSPDFAGTDIEPLDLETGNHEPEGNSELRRLFLKAALVARDPGGFEEVPNLTTRERRALRRERHATLWSQTTGLHRTVIVLCLSGIIQGWLQSTINGSNLTWWSQTGLADPTTDSYARSVDAAVNSIVYFSAAIACFLSDPLQAWLMGRRSVILISAILCFAASIGAACTPKGTDSRHPPEIGDWQVTWPALLGCRIVLGVAMGLKAAVTPIYGSEISPKRLRGSIVMLWQLCDAAGIMLGFAANLIAFSSSNPDSSWRWQMASVILPALCLMTLIWTVPESPRWYLGRGKFGQAFTAMSILRPNPLQAARDLFYANSQLQAELRYMRGEQQQQEPGNEQTEELEQSLTAYQTYVARTTWISRLLSTFKDPRTFRAQVSAIIVMSSQQLCGINALCFYSSNFFSFDALANKSAPVLKPLGLSLGIGAANLLFTLPAFKWIDRVGRRRLLLITYPGMIGSMLLACLAFACSKGRFSEPLIDFAVFSFVFWYSLGQGPVAFTYSAEVFPLVFREAAMSIAVAFNLFGAGILTLCVTQAQFIGSNSWSQKLTNKSDNEAYTITQAIVLGVFVALEIIAFFLIFFFVPETSGTTIGRRDDSLTYMSLEELNYIFQVPIFIHSRYQLEVMLPWTLRKTRWWLFRWFMDVKDPGQPELLYRWAAHQRQEGSEDGDGGSRRDSEDGEERRGGPMLPRLDLPGISLVDIVAREHSQ